MHDINKIWSGLLSVLLLCSISCYGQSKNNTYFHIGLQEGLASNNVRAIIQDHNRYIWVGTENGLQKYDGRKFVSYHKKFFNNNSLLSDNVEQLFEDKDSTIWIATLEGICTLDPKLQKFTEVPISGIGQRPIDAKSFFQDSKGNIWLAGIDNGLFRYNKKANFFFPIPKGPGSFKWKIHAIIEGRRPGLYWLGCDSGLAVYDISNDEIYTQDKNPLNIPELKTTEVYRHAIVSLFEDNNSLWVLTRTHKEKQYRCYSINSGTGKLVCYKPSENQQHGFWQDRHGAIWLYGSIYNYYDQQEQQFYAVQRSKEKNGIDYGITCQPLEDVEHNMWVGTDKGIYISNANNQKVFTKYFSAPQSKLAKDCQVMDFLKLNNGDIWTATWECGIFVYDSELHQTGHWDFIKNTSDDNYKLIRCMYQAKDGKVWIACQLGRIIVYDSKTRQFDFLKPEICKNNTIRSIAEDADNNIWLGTNHDELIKWDHLSGVFIKYSDTVYDRSQNNGAITKIIADKKGNIWAATNNGGLMNFESTTGRFLAHYKPQKNNPNTLSSSHILCGIDDDSTLILGTSMGLNIFNKRTKIFKHITTEDGLPANTVYSVDKDANGSIWLKLYDGLAKVTLPKKEITMYGEMEGLINKGDITTVSRLIGDKMFVGCNTGFMYFPVNSMIKNDTPPDVQITNLRVLDKEVNIDSIFHTNQPMQLTHSQNFLSIEFTSPSFFSNNLKYYYLLEGIDNDWVQADGSLTTNYASLPGGNYQFKVMCVNSAGVRSKNITTLHISIKPPFWRTWWFISLSVLFVAGVAYGFEHLRVNRLLTMERVRERIALDLHDDMGSTLSTINILSEMAKMKVKTDVAKTEEYIGKIGDNSIRMMEAMDDIVWSINPMNDNMQKIVARMREYAANILEAKNIEYHFSIGEHINDVKMKMETRKDLFLIYKEALNNVAKYSGCKNAYIDITILNSRLIMKIQDDGIGFDVNDADNGNGLSNMYKRAEYTGGKLTIESKINVGTKLILEIQLT